MNKSELIHEVAQDTGFSKKDTEVFLNSTLDAIIGTVAEGESVQLIGFGTFERRHRAARQGRNPQTGEPLVIPAFHTVGFRAGKHFKEAVKGQGE